MLRFEIDDAYIARHEPHEAGGRELREYWIPSEEMEEFNDHLVGPIHVVSEWRGDPPTRVR